MGYTHYWRRKKEFDVGAFARVVEDFKKVRAAVGPMVPLAGFDGEGDAEVTPDVICFNGVRECEGGGGRCVGRRRRCRCLPAGHGVDRGLRRKSRGDGGEHGGSQCDRGQRCGRDVVCRVQTERSHLRRGLQP